MLTRNERRMPATGGLPLVLCLAALTLAAACGDRGGGYITVPGSGSPGTGPDTTGPVVAANYPGGSETEIAVNAVISMSFSEPVDPSTVTAATIQVRDSANLQITGSLNCSGANVTFTPSSWLSTNTTYTVVVTTGVADLSGNPLGYTYQWRFTTSSRSDPIPPAITAMSPASLQTGVALSTSITITFSEPVDPATITAANVTLSETGNVPVSANRSVNGAALVLTPASALKYRVTYTVCITSQVTDLAGNPLPSTQCWNFTTADNSGLFAPYTAIPTGSRPEAVAVGDVTGDGRNDVVLVTSFYFDPEHDYHVFLFAQDAQGGLATAVTCTTSGTYVGRPLSIAVGDINNDGRNEIVVGHDRSNIEIFSYTGTGTLVSVATYTSVDTSWIRLADLNNDGLLDVAGIGWGTNTASVFLQNAQGTLNLPVTYAVTHGGWDDLEVGDINNDGLADIIVMSGQSYAYPNIGVLAQNNGGTFAPAVYYDLGGNQMTHGVAVGDVSGDARKDIVVTGGGNSPGSHIAAFLQNTAGTLDAAVSSASYDCPEPVDIADMNGDGRKDIIVLHSGWLAAGIYLQNADGSLGTEERYNLPYASYGPHGLAVGDINSDGSNDIVIADGNNGLVILYHH